MVPHTIAQTYYKRTYKAVMATKANKDTHNEKPIEQQPI